MESNYKNNARVQTELLIKLRLETNIVDHCSSYNINFGVIKMHSFLYDTQNVIHYGL